MEPFYYKSKLVFEISTRLFITICILQGFIFTFLISLLNISDRRDQQEFLNGMMLSLLESGQPSNLVSCFNFIDCLYKVLDSKILRWLASSVAERLNKLQKIELYDLCCNRSIYHCYTVSLMFSSYLKI